MSNERVITTPSYAASTVVQAISGHDVGSLYVVVGSETVHGQPRLLLCDGKHHKLDKPKRKNAKHVKRVGSAVLERETDAAIRRGIRQLTIDS